MVVEGRLPVISLKPINEISTCKYNNALMIACAKASAVDHEAIDNNTSEGIWSGSVYQCYCCCFLKYFLFQIVLNNIKNNF